MKTSTIVTTDDLKRAWRQCALVGSTFEQSMSQPALAIAVKCLAESNVRRQQRLEEHQRYDYKRAQANDNFAHE